jgi:hypothetical protein
MSKAKVVLAVVAILCLATVAQAQLAKVQVPNHGLVIDASLYSGPSGTGPTAYAQDVLVPWLQAGRNTTGPNYVTGQTWRGQGLWSSYTADFNDANGGEYIGIGMIVNADMADNLGQYFTSFGGLDLTTLPDPNPRNYIFLKPTIVEDTNLDGVIDQYDAFNFGASGGSPEGDINSGLPSAWAWMIGDGLQQGAADQYCAFAFGANSPVTYNDVGTEPDVWVIPSGASAHAGVTTVPEPSTVVLLLAAIAGLAAAYIRKMGRV